MSGENTMTMCARAFFLLAAAFLATAPAAADHTCTFESGLGKNALAIGTSIGPWWQFGTATGGSMRFADINTGNYRVTSDNGKVIEDGEYFFSGDFAAFVVNSSDIGKLSFLMGSANHVTVGYSSQFGFAVEAYDSAGGLLTSASGTANAKSQGGTGIGYLTVSSPGIAYVLMHDHGGYWLVDNISSDATIPEPASMCSLAALLLGLAFRRRTRV